MYSRVSSRPCPRLPRPIPTRPHVREVSRSAVDIRDDALMQRLLIALQRQDIIPLAIDDLRGDRLLGPHRIDRDDRTWMSTSRRSSGMAVISFDFSSHATCPSDRPNSLAQTLTECNAPRPVLRSWLHRHVLPSIARTGCSTPVAAAAAARNDFSQLAKHAWKAPGWSAIRTRRNTSLRGTPLGRSAPSPEDLP